jgi:hypothetical protein
MILECTINSVTNNTIKEIEKRKEQGIRTMAKLRLQGLDPSWIAASISRQVKVYDDIWFRCTTLRYLLRLVNISHIHQADS